MNNKTAESRHVRRTGAIRRAVLGILAATFIASAQTAPAGAANANDEPVLQTQRAAASVMRAYWTDERMRTAKPMPLPVAFGQLSTQSNDPAPLPSGPAVIADAGGPGDAPVERVVDAVDVQGFALEPQANPGPFAFTGYRLFPNATVLYQQFPYMFVGKVFFTIPGRGDFVCSGSVVNAPNRSLVWTAGHCVYTKGIGFHTNFVFVPARHEEHDPYERWTAHTLGAPRGWVDHEFFEYDHGAAFMNRGGPLPGDYLVGQLGYLGFAANLPRQQHWHLHGYPAQGAFDGEHHHLCATNWATDDQPDGRPGIDPQTIGVGCDMTGGSSGGPWVLDLNGDPGSGNFVNGNISYSYFGDLDRLYGPYFGNAAIALRDALGNL